MNQRFLAVCNDSYILREVRSLNDLVDSPSKGENRVEIVDTIADPTPDLFHLHENAQLADFVRKFVNSLPARLRTVALLRYWEDKSQADIARALGISPSAVSQAIDRINTLGRRAIFPLLH